MRQATFVIMLLVTCRQATANMSDVDQMDTQSETSSTADLENVKETPTDPNLVNPQPDQGYGVLGGTFLKMSTTQKPKKPLPTTPKPSFSQQSMRAVLELGIIVSYH